MPEAEATIPVQSCQLLQAPHYLKTLRMPGSVNLLPAITRLKQDNLCKMHSLIRWRRFLNFSEGNFSELRDRKRV